MTTNWDIADAVALRALINRIEFEMLRNVPRDSNIAGYMLALDNLKGLAQDTQEQSETAKFVDMSNNKQIGA